MKFDLFWEAVSRFFFGIFLSVFFFFESYQDRYNKQKAIFKFDNKKQQKQVKINKIKAILGFHFDLGILS